MVKTRLIPVLYIKNGLIVRSEDFSYHQNIGNIINEASRYNEWNVDELIYIDISRTDEYDLRRDDHKIKSYSNKQEIITEIARVCFMPLSFGGGIRSLVDIDVLIKSGADKITLNTAAFENPQLIKESALKYGSQAIVASVDYRKINSEAIVFTNFGQTNTGVKLLDWVIELEKLGAGEIFMNAIDRDGKASGYDTETIGQVVDASKLPVIACGGAADEYDFVDLAKATKVSGIAAGNMFHFTERSYPRAKQTLKKNGINVR
ncbi:MAG: imidazole glycerol phosphate synthase subunit HisF [Bacteroidetes bacterium]|nr:imidazole glycerol phosphate synthase subunit HisF [Bacteroidota bacterium]MBK9671983.1 imidazole glycerol phosphate synthase subunit HisF [Bacteroidota bacterium]MBK9800402.1 imidazole glycerol phosphate synthase subunit HisF [Bacteroidota bacterium]